MAFSTERDKVGVIQQGLNHPFWTEYLFPLLRQKAANALDALATKHAEDDDIKRGRYQAYRDILECPGREVAAFNEAESIAAEANQVESTEQYRADYGFRSPIRQAPEVGETTGEAANDG